MKKGPDALMAEIRDPIHGYVKVDEMAKALIDTPQIQRLRWIKQLGLANLVYPGANHTRFEHSLGVCHLAGVLAEGLGLKEEDKARVKAAALLHDVGHGPLSHATEIALLPYLRKGHTDIGDILRKGELKEVLDAHGLLPQDIQALVKGEGPLGQVVSSEIDVDRMDYLMRDSHYTGVAYGVIDLPRLLQRMRLKGGHLVVDSGGVQAATSLLISRLLMHPSVYYHHVSRISESMVAAGIRRLIDDGVRKAEEIKVMDDMSLFTSMDEAGGYAREMASRIKSRKLLKRSVYVGLEEFGGSKPKGGERRIAREVAEEAGVDPEYVLVDNPPIPDAPEGDFLVLTNSDSKDFIDADNTNNTSDARPLRDISPLVAMLEKAHQAAWRFGIYARAEERVVVEQAAKRYLNLRRSALQHTLADLDG